MTDTDITGEQRCECGAVIPKGFGYYILGKKYKCICCGRVHQGKPMELDQ